MYKDFIVEASRLYADAYEDSSTDPSKLVKIVHW